MYPKVEGVRAAGPPVHGADLGGRHTALPDAGTYLDCRRGSTEDVPRDG